MKVKIKIGIPRALLFYRYGSIWLNFFNDLDCDVICSPRTNKKILEDGIKHSIDESCLALKIYLGHVKWLENKVDYILVPRIKCLKRHEKMCTNFNALFDIVNNTFDLPLLDYNVDVEEFKTEKKAFLNLGKILHKTKKETLKAYYKAKRINKRETEYRYLKQDLLLKKGKEIKILLASHDYNLYDALVGERITSILKSLNVDIIYTDIFEEKKIKDQYKKLSETLYWTYNKEMLSSIEFYSKDIDGLILLSVFPCGPDALINEIILRKFKKPVTNIIVDELTSEIGLQTRIESFIDIIKSVKKGRKNNEKD